MWSPTASSPKFHSDFQISSLSNAASRDLSLLSVLILILLVYTPFHHSNGKEMSHHTQKKHEHTMLNSQAQSKAQKRMLQRQQDFPTQRNRFAWMTVYIKRRKGLDGSWDLFLPFTSPPGKRLFSRMLSAAFLGGAPKNVCWYYWVAFWKDLSGALKSQAYFLGQEWAFARQTTTVINRIQTLCLILRHQPTAASLGKPPTGYGERGCFPQGGEGTAKGARGRQER